MEGDLVEGQNVEGNANVEENKSPDRAKLKKIIALSGLALVGTAAVVWFIARFLIPGMAKVAWCSNKMIAIYIAAGVIGVAVAAGFILRRRFRARWGTQKGPEG